MNDRKLSRKILALLPKQIRFALMRKSVKIDPNWPSTSLEIKIAESEEELASAYQLLHDSYVKSGFMNPDPTGMRVLPQHLLPQTTTIIAKWDGKIIGTLSLIRDNPFGLPLEKIFDVNTRRFNGRRLAEVSSLAVDPLYRGQVNKALFPLFRFVYQYARDCFGIHEFVIAVNPSMVDLYLGFMCFEQLKAKQKSYDFVKGAPAVGLFLDFETTEKKWKKIFAHRPLASNFHQYWTIVPSDLNNRLPKKQYHSASYPILTPYLLEEFFLKRAQLEKKLTSKDIRILMDAYPFSIFQKVLKPLFDKVSRRNIRLETQMKAEWIACHTTAEVLNVSREGLLVRTEKILKNHGEQLQINVWLNNHTPTILKVEVLRSSENVLQGLKIIETTKEWNLMIESLEMEHQNIPATVKKAA